MAIKVKSMKNAVIGGSLVTVGLVCTIVALANYGSASTSLAWPTVLGTVKSSELEPSLKKDGTVIGYVPVLAYDFAVESKVYTSARIGFDSKRYRDKKDAEAVLKMYPLFATVAVYYNSKDPNFAVLEPGVPIAFYIFISIGIACLMVGLVIGALGFASMPSLGV